MALFPVACLWVLAAAGVAMLPLKRQYLPGFALMYAAPVMIYLLGRAFGLLAGYAALLAFRSMFRNPLCYHARRAMGTLMETPK